MIRLRYLIIIFDLTRAITWSILLDNTRIKRQAPIGPASAAENKSEIKVKTAAASAVAASDRDICKKLLR